MIYPEIPLAQSIIEICKAHQIQHIVISPGSRNAPLTIGFVNDTYFTCYSIADERCAAFFGMGIAQQKQYPVALICTSGSALLNYYPALAEAFYSEIPLIVISADRPTSKIDIGDGQTIRQRNVYENHSVFNANLTEDASVENDQLIHTAIQTSIDKKGPVHINAPFEEPLYKTVETLSISKPKKITVNEHESIVFDINPYRDVWEKSSKKLILVGVCNPNVLEKKVLEFLSKDPSTVVLTEVTSNLHNANFVEHIDRIITPFTEDDFKSFKPELLITFGGMIISKRIKTFLRKYKPENHWHIDTLRYYDTYGCLNAKIKTTPNIFFNALIEKNISPKVSTQYQQEVLKIAASREKAHKNFLNKAPFSDLKVFEFLLNQLPSNCQLQISNSSGIRYAQLFKIDPSIEIFSNRGTSGIDGSTSTSIGAAVGSEKQTILITGDISFLYDSNALWNNYIPNNYKIILLNNQGGGIFRILPGHKEVPVFNTFFETRHQFTAGHLAKMYNFNYYFAENEDNLKEQIKQFWSSNDKPSLLEIRTPTTTNDEILKEYFKKLI